MTSYNWPNGIGAATGDALGICKPLETSGSMFYVDYASGSDSFDGGDEARPKKTLAAAVAAGSPNDIIALLPTHNELITAVVTPKDGQTIVGLGRTAGRPSARLTKAAEVRVLDLGSANGVEVRNIYFPEATVANASTVFGKIRTRNNGHHIADCYFECGQNDNGYAIAMNATTAYLTIRDCIFVSVSTAPVNGSETQSPPLGAMQLSASANDWRLEGITLDGGVGGWGDYYAANFSGFAITRFRGEQWKLLGGSDVRIHASSTGYLNPQTVEGSGKVFW